MCLIFINNVTPSEERYRAGSRKQTLRFCKFVCNSCCMNTAVLGSRMLPFNIDCVMHVACTTRGVVSEWNLHLFPKSFLQVVHVSCNLEYLFVSHMFWQHMVVAILQAGRSATKFRNVELRNRMCPPRSQRMMKASM